MSYTEDEEIETSLDVDWLVSLNKRVSDTKFSDRGTEPTIFRVPEILKKVDRQAYEPVVVSLGPYHRNKSHLQDMNQLKWKCLKYVLDQSPMVLEDYLGLIKKLETQARAAYSEEVEMSSNSFVEMMLLDGCFLMLTIMGENYGMTSNWWTENVVVRDIFMLENQLPFVLLETLYEFAFGNRYFFRRLTVNFISKSFPRNPRNWERLSDQPLHHIIDLCLSCIDPITNHGNDNDNDSGNGNGNQSSTFGFLCNSELVKTVCVSWPSKLSSSLSSLVNKIRTGRVANSEEDYPVHDLPWIPSARVVNEAGIRFKRKQTAKSFLDITFLNGRLEIPQLHVCDDTNMLLRNLIAYEQCLCSGDSKFHVTSYMVLMNYLIDTATDVELLQQHEIIIGDLGDSQEIATLFNKLSENVTYNIDDFYLVKVLTDMRKHHDATCNKWRAKLNRDYFSNPWAAISLFGALALFILTVIQTTYAGLSYHP